MKKFGFTMAEALFTLGVIGFISVISLPALQNSTKFQEMDVELRRTYYELNQIAMRFSSDNKMTVSEYSTMGNHIDFIEKKFPEYLAGVQKVADYKSGATIDDRPYVTYLMNGKSTGLPCDNGGYHKDIHGRFYTFDDRPSSGYNGPRVCVDVNGIKPPNRLGVDTFSFLFTVDGRVIPEGMDHPNNFYDGQGIHWAGGTLKADGTNNCNSKNYSVTCAYYAINNESPTGEGRYWQDFIAKKIYEKF